jgi:hypothetical protein
VRSYATPSRSDKAGVAIRSVISSRTGRWGGCVLGFRGNGPALAGKLGGGWAFALRAMARVIASNARSGPFPLPPRAGSVPHIYTKGATLYYSDAIVIGPVTGCPEAIRWGNGKSRALGWMRLGVPRERSCARREARGRMGFRAVRDGNGDRFQCSLRPVPAAAAKVRYPAKGKRLVSMVGR